MKDMLEHSNLNILRKNTEWITSILRKKNIPNIESVFYACTLPGGKVFLQTYEEKIYIYEGKGKSK